MVQLPWKPAWQFLKIKNRTVIWPIYPTSRNMVKGNEIRILKTYLHSHGLCNIIHNSQGKETSVCLHVNGQRSLKHYIFPLYIVFFSQRRQEIFAICDNMDGSWNTVLSHLYVESKKKKNQTRGNREWWLSGVVGRENEKLLVKEYTLSVVRRISSGESNIRHGDYS